MAPRDKPDPAKTRHAVLAVAQWLRDESAPEPARDEVATAVRLRIPPFAAVQCIPGPAHTRGTPPNVVETEPRTWLLLVTGKLAFADARRTGALRLSGSRAGEIEHCLPLFDVD